MLRQSVSMAFLPQALKLQEELHVSQFLMNLPAEFEPVRVGLMNRENCPDLDTCVQEVLRKETSPFFTLFPSRGNKDLSCTIRTISD